MRKPPTNVLPTTLQVKADRIIMVRHYRLITPLFGGGVEPGKVDTQVTPIRGTSIRGQLRFWWRATCGGRYSTITDLREAEGALWGSIEHASPVAVDVKITDFGTDFNPNLEVGDPRSPYGYAAFPLRDSHGRIREGLRFTLTLSFPTDKQTVNDVQATLWAWDTFGGIGARTRRGFGALACEQVSARNGDQQFPTQGWQWEYQAANRQQVEQQLFRDGGHFVAKGSWAANVPHLSRSTAHYKVVVLNNNPDEYSVWKHLIKALKDFRQERDANFGRSHWPEPDAIRARTGQSLPAHRIPKHASPLNTKFPRAAFGLPIIFEFQNGAPDAGTVGQDPRKTTLSGAGVTRLASPLILRPLACGNGQYVGLALVLEGTHLPVLQLKDNAGVVLGSTPIADLDATDAANLSNKHTDYDRNTTDVLQAFLKTLK